jgi:SAM-dependent methyltransferase
MHDDPEKKVANYYNTLGWEIAGEVTEDARRSEDLRACASDYVSRCRLRVLRYIPASGDKLLDMASGPIQYPEYLAYSKNFRLRYCVDLSAGALEQAKARIGEHGVYLHGSFFDIPLEENLFDCSISLHTVYHIAKERQEEAVRKLLLVTKPGRPVIIVYSNPNTLIDLLKTPLRLLLSLKEIIRRFIVENRSEEPSLYFHPYPLSWWLRFSDTAEVRIYPWRSFSSDVQKMLIPDNRMGSILLAMLFNLEERFPNFFAKHFQYPMIILYKK